MYRDQLDAMSPSEFIWMSYTTEVMEFILEQYLRGSAIWGVVVPLICWEIVELHRPERCLRQFGFDQPIPTHPPLDLSGMHSYHFRGNFMVDWSHRHMDSIRDWNDRESHIASGVPLSNLEECNSQYFTWYGNITRLLIGNPRHRRHPVDGYHAMGSGAVVLVNTVQACMRKIDEAIEIANLEVQRKLTEIKETCHRGLEAIGSSFGCSGTSSLFDDRAYNLPRSMSQPKHQNLNQRGRGVRRGGRRKQISIDTNAESQENAQNMLALVPFTGEASTSARDEVFDSYIPESQPEVVAPPVTRPRRVRKTVSRYTPS